MKIRLAVLSFAPAADVQPVTLSSIILHLPLTFASCVAIVPRIADFLVISFVTSITTSFVTSIATAFGGAFLDTF